jgi:hypothetical protein
MNHRFAEIEGGIKGGIVKPAREKPWPGNLTMYILGR